MIILYMVSSKVINRFKILSSLKASSGIEIELFFKTEKSRQIDGQVVKSSVKCQDGSSRATYKDESFSHVQTRELRTEIDFFEP